MDSNEKLKTGKLRDSSKNLKTGVLEFSDNEGHAAGASSIVRNYSQTAMEADNSDRLVPDVPPKKRSAAIQADLPRQNQLVESLRRPNMLTRRGDHGGGS